MTFRIGTTAVAALLILGAAGCSKSKDKAVDSSPSADAGHASPEGQVATELRGQTGDLLAVEAVEAARRFIERSEELDDAANVAAE